MKRLLGVCLVAGLVAGGLAGCSNSPTTLVFSDVNPQSPRLGEAAVVRFEAIDSNRNPLPGVNVTFALQGNPDGVTISPTQTTTDATGFASTAVTSTNRVSAVVVTATTGSGTTAVTILSPAISFAGGNSNSVQFTFQCGELDGAASGGIHGIRSYSPSRSMVAGVKINCHAHVGDRNGDGVVGQQVSFLTEAGTIDASSTTITDTVGNADVLYKTTYPLPVETTPTQFTWNPLNDTTHTGQYLVPLWMDPWLWSANPFSAATPDFNEPRRPDPIRLQPSGQPMQLNPRDNLVTLIAITTGDEAYSDDNDNGQHDDNEPFTDLTEPFVDSNDNGTWDEGERYVDVNGDMQWNGKNGQYDANTTIWASERILWTGVPDGIEDIRTDNGNIPVLPLPRTGLSSCGTDGVTGASNVDLNVPHFGSALFAFVFSDPWFNSMARDDGGDNCVLGGTSQAVNSDPSNSGGFGIRYEYPPVDHISIVITDTHDPNELSQNGMPIPPYNPAVLYKLPVTCTMTASLVSGDKLTFTPTTVVGCVE